MDTLLHICGNCGKEFNTLKAATLHQSMQINKVCKGKGINIEWCAAVGTQTQKSDPFEDLDAQQNTWDRVMGMNAGGKCVVHGSDSSDDDSCNDNESHTTTTCNSTCSAAGVDDPNSTVDVGLPPESTMQDVFGNATSMQLGYFINDIGLSNQDSKRLISIFKDAQVDIDFNSADILKKRLAKASLGLGLPQFTCEDFKDANDGKYFDGPILMAYRNVIDLVKSKFSQRHPTSDFVLSAAEGGFYSNINSGNWWKRVERNVKQEHGEDVHLLVVYMYSDETQVTSFGSTSAYPLHVSIANFIGDAQKDNSQILLAYLPVCAPYKGGSKTTYVKQRSNAIRQEALQRVLTPLREAGNAPQDLICPDGITRLN